MDIHEFQELVWQHYQRQGRIFPWRDTADPYAITVSEIMLQQTQTERVVPKYEKFLHELPTWQALAEVPPARLLELWQGLGYNRRALALKRLAETVIKDYGGALPHTQQELVKLPGIGPYTAGAILAFAFNQPVMFIETNIRRVFLHHFFADRQGVNDKELWPYIEKSLDTSNPREWYWALMDYGAWLSKQLPNPNRRSAHYTKQSTFEGSMRQLRGRILRLLLQEPGMSRGRLRELLADDPARADAAINQMAEEGFLVTEGEAIYLPS